MTAGILACLLLNLGFWFFRPVVIIGLGICLFRILWIWTVFRAFPELRVLFSVYPASWILTGLLVTGAYLMHR